MKSRHELLPDAHSRRRLALFRSSAAAGVVALLFGAVVLLPPAQTPGADTASEMTGAAPRAAASETPTTAALVVGESAGTDRQDPHAYVGQPAVF